MSLGNLVYLTLQRRLSREEFKEYYLFLPKLLLSHMHKSLPELHGIPAEVPNFLDLKFKSFLAFQICRDILVRDAVRFHKFNNGTCSCGDFW
uniref:DYW domain-containing protein n=1 Tax=Oryza nivara TaxID=4536 RepID=A0A0E0FZY0_ORYNI